MGRALGPYHTSKLTSSCLLQSNQIQMHACIISQTLICFHQCYISFSAAQMLAQCINQCNAALQDIALPLTIRSRCKHLTQRLPRSLAILFAPMMICSILSAQVAEHLHRMDSAKLRTSMGRTNVASARQRCPTPDPNPNPNPNRDPYRWPHISRMS